MTCRSRSLSSLTVFVGMTLAIGCGGSVDNSLFTDQSGQDSGDGADGTGGFSGEDAGRDDDASTIEDAGGGGSAGHGGSGGSGAGDAGDDGGGMGGQGGGGAGGAGGADSGCPSHANSDLDGDGFTVAQGDCDDCNPSVNPGAYDFAGNGLDEDCSGVPDDEPLGCDEALDMAAANPFDAAKSLGICRLQTGGSWGLVSAKWVFPDGTSAGLADGDGCLSGYPPHAQSRGILKAFGPKLSPRQGTTMLALSSGVARAGENTASGNGANGNSPSQASMATCSAPPSGYPVASPSCGSSTPTPAQAARDGIALELDIKVPTNVRSLGFDLDFHTFEFPIYYCSEYNDFFVALLYSSHPELPSDKNIAFDDVGNPFGVNNEFLEVCKAQTVKEKVFACSRGLDELLGTGFDSTTWDGPHAATSWLRTSASVLPGETIRLRFAIWDGGDHLFDSTVLLDNFRWEAEARPVGTTRITP